MKNAGRWIGDVVFTAGFWAMAAGVTELFGWPWAAIAGGIVAMALVLAGRRAA